MRTLHFNTRGAQVMTGALDRCAREQILTVIIANPGRGKTYGTKRWSQSSGAKIRHICVTCTVRTSPSALLRALCGALDMPGEGEHTADRACAAIATRLANDPMMIIVDEADMLSVPSIEKLRGIWDEVSEMRGTDGERAFPLALVGTARLRTLLLRDDLERLRSRVAEFDELPGLTENEIRQIVEKAWPAVRLDDAALPQLCWLSRGSFRWLGKIMGIAAELAAKDGKVVNARILKATREHQIGLPEEE